MDFVKTQYPTYTASKLMAGLFSLQKSMSSCRHFVFYFLHQCMVGNVGYNNYEINGNARADNAILKVHGDIPFEACSISPTKGRGDMKPRTEYSLHYLTLGSAKIDLLHDLLCDSSCHCDRCCNWLSFSCNTASYCTGH